MRGILWLAALLLGSALVPASAESLDGVWRSQGYGYVYEIHGKKLKAFEVTASTCVPSFRAKQDGAVVSGEVHFKSNEGDRFFVKAGGSVDHKLLHVEGSASDVRIDRIPQLPAVCDKPTANTPPGNFEVFTRTWAEHYISFDLKHSNWENLVAENRTKVNSRTTSDQLFDIFTSMIRPFGDAHTGIYEPKRSGRSFRGIRPGTDRAAHEMRTLLALTDRAYLKEPPRKFCNGQIEYGHVDGKTGYLRILAFGGYSQSGGFREDLAALESALDEIFSDRTLAALVIDVRVNPGGADPLGLAIAARLATDDYVAYIKEARADPNEHDKWTPADPSIVHPSSRPGFLGPVVELIGPLTVSAGETFTQALMGRTPHVTRIGENTQGVFSDVLDRRLPNGWHFGLPNEVFRTTQGTTFDGPGIPPDIALPVFADEDVAAGKDPVMARALEILRGER